jgi:ABC-type Fe3+ transport system permease subunit
MQAFNVVYFGLAISLFVDWRQLQNPIVTSDLKLASIDVPRRLREIINSLFYGLISAPTSVRR